MSTVELPRPGVPADRGLAALGLVMQLAGSVATALTVLLGVAVPFEAGVRHPGLAAIVVVTCLVRARLHVEAGRDLVSGTAGGPARSVLRYAGFGVAHALLLGWLAASARTSLALAGALALWPCVLIAVTVLARRTLAGYDGAQVPLGEDRGLEGASLVMTVIGVCGVLATAAVLGVLGALPGHRLAHGWGPLITAVLVLLLGHAALHVRAGLVGLRASSFDRPAELVAPYLGLGVASAAGFGSLQLLLAISGGRDTFGLAAVAFGCWLLASWPAIVQRFFHHRQLAELLDGDRVIHRRAPDAGLTALGWLLAGHASLVASVALAGAVLHPVGAARIALELSALAGIPGPSLAGTAVIVGLEAACAIALITMHDRRRAIVRLYAVAAGALALAPLAAGELGVIQLAPAALQLAIPVATLVLVHRAVAPVAVARYRRRWGQSTRALP